MTKHLLIWEEIPEHTKAYILISPDDDDIIDLAQQSMGYYINAEENEAVNDLNEALGNRKVDYNSTRPHNVIKDGPFVAVYICGFVM